MPVTFRIEDVIKWEDYQQVCHAAINKFNAKWNWLFDHSELLSLGEYTFVEVRARFIPSYGVSFGYYYHCALNNTFRDYVKSFKGAFVPIDPANVPDTPAEQERVSANLEFEELMATFVGDARELATHAVASAERLAGQPLRSVRAALRAHFQSLGWSTRRYYGAVDAIEKVLQKTI